MPYKIIKKTTKEGMIHFALNDTETGKEITSSDLLFDPKFLEKSFKKDLYEFTSLKTEQGLEILDENFVKKIYLGYLGRLLLKNHFKYKLDDFEYKGFMVEEGSLQYYRIGEVKIYLAQFLGPEGYYNATSKLNSLQEQYKACDEDIYLQGLYFYEIEKIDDMDSMLRYVMMNIKNFQKRKVMDSMLSLTFGKNLEDIKSFIQRKKIDTICVVPNNVSRKISFNAVIEDFLGDSFEEIPFLKVNVHDFEGRKPQKATRGLCERIKNADQLFTVDSLENGIIPKRILLIDDVFGSGATMNMIAKKIKVIYPDVEILGFAILGSYRKGFDVINEI